jgi:antitoxin (DNA-binding transcriptional repressor) of toxin-antitoxin stability system
MDQVGMRELRHKLRQYLARVEAGEFFQVTVFGRPVAELRPVQAGKGLERLIAEGRVTPALTPNTSNLPPLARVTSGTTATEALLAERSGDLR